MSTAAFTHPSSYRDPSGFIFEKGGILYRQVNKIFKEDFDSFIQSGLYEYLVEKGLLISHQVVPGNLTGSPDHYLTLLPEKIAFISYVYEWSSEMFRDAALLTLQLVKEAVSFGLMLKDATPYNIQWHKGKLIFIDSLSFEKYNETEPWIAYRQFCESFLGPLLLMHYSKMPLQQLQLAYPDGIPLAIIKSLLPKRSRFSLYTYLHIHLHAGIAAKKNNATKNKAAFSKHKLLNLVNSLESLVKQLKLPQLQSAWSEYYEEAAQREDYLEEKVTVINNWVNQLNDIKTVVDLGANEGKFSELLAAKNIDITAVDADPLCIDNLYRKIKSSGIKKIQPLIIDLAHPSPSIGVNNEERDSFSKRCKADLTLALALIHHLAIGKNIPFEKIAGLFSKMAPMLIIEFIPMQDNKIQMMLNSKKDIYAGYNEQNFLAAFEKNFTIIERKEINTTNRILFLMKKKP